MGAKIILAFLFFVLVVGLLTLYWFIPTEKIEFGAKYNTSDFAVDNITEEDMQFYSSMRFLNKRISYRIFDCPPVKRGNMEGAFDFMAGLTPLVFYPVDSSEQISVTCEYTDKVKGNIFIAGEGGPTNVSVVGDFHVISGGEILLIRDSGCTTPNVAIHELLHVLGFKHTPNPKNIMYNFSNCGQEVGEDILSRISEIYSTPNYPDLAVSDLKIVLDGRMLNVNMTVWNYGLANSLETEVVFYAGDKRVGEMDLPSLGVGQGSKIFWKKGLLFTNFDEVEVKVPYTSQELDSTNNNVVLKIKE